MKKQKWHLFKINLPGNYQDLLVGSLNKIGFRGFLQDTDILNCYLPASCYSITFKKSLDNLLSNFKKEFPNLELSYSKKILYEQNWNKKWEQRTGIVEATRNIIIKPSWKRTPKRLSKNLSIIIEPKMSFGTGHHETTRLCLGMIERYLKPKMDVLDFGCGTGILGIASAKLGARSVLSIDNDEWAVKNTIENIKKNKTENKIKVILGTIDSIPKRKFDLIVANIDAPTIMKSIKTLSSRLSKEGILILSGILINDVYNLLPLIQKHSLIPIGLDNENSWVAIALGRN